MPVLLSKMILSTICTRPEIFRGWGIIDYFAQWHLILSKPKTMKTQLTVAEFEHRTKWEEIQLSIFLFSGVLTILPRQ